jgi:cytochrome b involved in lipid metabolism
VRVLEIDAEDESETEFTMPDSFRGIVDEETQVFVSADSGENDASFELLNASVFSATNSLASQRTDVVTVITNDEEEFPVKKKLLFPCIKLSSAVLSGKGVHKDSSTTIEVDIDCLTFDRVLLYLEHEARNDGTEFQFDPSHAEDLLTAATKVGCIGLQEVCQKRLGEFETRVRKESIRWQEVVRRNNSGEVWLVMLGMVFDVTRWLPEHPGGSIIIPEQAVNVDCTVMFEIYHSSRQSFRYLKQFYIGEIDEADLELIPSSAEKPSAAFIEELRQVRFCIYHIVSMLALESYDACTDYLFWIVFVGLMAVHDLADHAPGQHIQEFLGAFTKTAVVRTRQRIYVSPYSFMAKPLVARKV